MIPRETTTVTQREPRMAAKTASRVETTLNRMYSILLVRYYALFLIVGFIVCLTLTGLSFTKLPLPNFLDPKRGFGARGEGTLTSQLLVLRNINDELKLNQAELLRLYNDVKKANLTTPSEDSLPEVVPIDDLQYDSEEVTDAQLGENDEYDDENPPEEEPELEQKIITRSLSEPNKNEMRINSRFKYGDIMRDFVWENYTGADILALIPDLETLGVNVTSSAFAHISHCSYSLELDRNFELYFESSVPPPEDTETEANSTHQSQWDLSSNHSRNLLNIHNIHSLCKWDKKILSLLQRNHEKRCYFSLPFLIALLSSKSDCSLITPTDIDRFISVIHECSPLYRTGILYAAAVDTQPKTEIMQLLDSDSRLSLFAQLPEVRNHVCFKQNLMHIAYEYVLDSVSLQADTPPSHPLNTNYSSLWIMNSAENRPVDYSQEEVFNFYMKHFHKQEHDDGRVRIAAINLVGVREEAAMRLLSQDMILVVVAIFLICIVTLLYLRSILIAIIVDLGVIMSVGIAFFVYRIAFDLDLFPFLNMMAAFLLIGIACDNVFVLFDAWFNEKARILAQDYLYELSMGSSSKELDDKYMAMVHPSRRHIAMFLDRRTCELNPAWVRVARLSELQMIRVMGGTLRHAASSIFVTSFTTAAAFLTNLITKLPYMQLFGLFTGTCIIVYFCLVITMISAFVVLYEKHTSDSCSFFSSISFVHRTQVAYDRLLSVCTRWNHKFVGSILPQFLIRFRHTLVVIFLLLGIGGMIAVFYKPQLKAPVSWRYQFFKSYNLFEVFEFDMRDQFLSYKLAEKRNYTNPEIFFIFGIHNKDTGRIFDPEDPGKLLYDNQFNYHEPASQVWFNRFINESLASRRDLFMVDELVKEWNLYVARMRLLCKDHGIGEIPFAPAAYKKCESEMRNMLINATIDNFQSIVASSPRRVVQIYGANGQVRGTLVRVKANKTFADFNTVEGYIGDLRSFYDSVKADAPNGYKSSWFISVGFALYDLQYQIIHGTYSSLVASMVIALITLLFTSGNIVISFFAIITISFTIGITIAFFVFLGWDLNILEAVVIIMSVGLSVDFSCHYGVAYIKADLAELTTKRRQLSQINASASPSHASPVKSERKKHSTTAENCYDTYERGKDERFCRIHETFNRVGSAVLMAAVTTFIAGFSMYPSHLTSFAKMGQFLMLVMFFSYMYATFFFVPLCALFGPTNNFGDLRLGAFFNNLAKITVKCLKLDKKSKTLQMVEEEAALEAEKFDKAVQEKLLHQSQLANGNGKQQSSETKC